MKALEAFIANLGITLAGLITIPLAGWLAGVSISTNQNLGMNAFFFVLRFFWLFGVRTYFERVVAFVISYFRRLF
jgi:hypothetical protein